VVSKTRRFAKTGSGQTEGKLNICGLYFVSFRFSYTGFEAPTMITKESCGELRLGVLLSRAAPALAKGEAPLSVNYHTADGTAEAGTDYIGKNYVMMNAQHQSKLLI